MKKKLKQIFTNVRVIILLVALIFAIFAIYPSPNAHGVAIRNVLDNSSASEAGIVNVKPTIAPMNREVITGINNQPIEGLDDYYDFVNNLVPGTTFTIQTNYGEVYQLTTREAFEVIELNETEFITVNETIQTNVTINGTMQVINETVEKTIEVPKTITESLGLEDIGLRVYEAPTSNVKQGLDLAGGTRVLLKLNQSISEENMELLLSNLRKRLNLFGLSDIIVKEANDPFSQTQYVVVEIAGANDEDVKDLLANEGNFEAKIGNETVFVGGDGDITYVCQSSDCSGLEPGGCGQIEQDAYVCRFRFSIALKPVAAQRQADITQDLEVITVDEEGNFISKDNQYLEKQLVLYLDGKEVDALNIGSSLQGRPVTDIQISGSGQGRTEQEAALNALDNMNKLKSVMVTGSLPVKLEIEKIDTLSPQLGKDFLNNAILVGIVAILVVASVVFIAYRKYEIFVPMIITIVSEVILLLGLAALIRWNLDLASIAGIIIAVGTGVDHQIVIADEILRGESDKYTSWKKKLKNAMYIIIAAYFTTAFAMAPLYFAGAGMLKGFAITTFFGITFGVFITRPAYAAILEIIMKK
jgi:preprotein translocase subunit SecD